MTPVIERLCLSYETKAEDVILSFNKLRNYDSKAWAEMAALSTEPLLWVCEDSLGGRNVELMPLHNDPLVVIAHEGSNCEYIYLGWRPKDVYSIEYISATSGAELRWVRKDQGGVLTYTAPCFAPQYKGRYYHIFMGGRA